MNHSYTATGTMGLEGKAGYKNVVRISAKTRPTVTTPSVDPTPTLVRTSYAGKPYDVLRIKDAILPAVTAKSLSIS